MFNRFTDKAKMSLNLARMAAQEFGHSHIEPEHVLHGVLSAGPSRAWQMLGANSVVIADVLKDIERRMPPREAGATKEGPLLFAKGSKLLLEGAMRAAAGAGHTWIGTEHLLVGLSESNAEVVAAVFRERGLTTGALKIALTTPVDSPEDVDARKLTLEGAARIAKDFDDSETARRIEALLKRLPA